MNVMQIDNPKVRFFWVLLEFDSRSAVIMLTNKVKTQGLTEVSDWTLPRFESQVFQMQQIQSS